MATCYYITREAFNQLNTEIEHLEYNVLPVIVNEVSTARGNGDLSENAEYHAAKDKQRETMKKIGYLKDFKVNAVVVDKSEMHGDTVKFGAYVKIQNLDTDKIKEIRLVGDYEADVNNDLLSIAAPIGKALLGKKKGDVVEIEMGDRIMAYEVLDLHY